MHVLQGTCLYDTLCLAHLLFSFRKEQSEKLGRGGGSLSPPCMGDTQYIAVHHRIMPTTRRENSDIVKAGQEGEHWAAKGQRH